MKGEAGDREEIWETRGIEEENDAEGKKRGNRAKTNNEEKRK